MIKELLTKTLKILWKNIRKENGLGNEGYYDGKFFCALGCTIVELDHSDSDGYSVKVQLGKDLRVDARSRTGAWIAKKNDRFIGTPKERRAYMMNLFGRELTRRGYPRKKVATKETPSKDSS